MIKLFSFVLVAGMLSSIPGICSSSGDTISEPATLSATKSSDFSISEQVERRVHPLTSPPLQRRSADGTLATQARGARIQDGWSSRRVAPMVEESRDLERGETQPEAQTRSCCQEVWSDCKYVCMSVGSIIVVGTVFYLSYKLYVYLHSL